MNDLDRELAPWKARADALIRRRIADARSHAEAGRMGAAGERLGELAAELARLIGDARASFFARESLRRGLTFEPDALAVAREHPILGRTPRDAARPLEGATRALGGASAAAEISDPATRKAIWDGWQARQADVLATLAASHLSDAQVSIANVVGLLEAETAEGGGDDAEAREESGRSGEGQDPGPQAEGSGDEVEVEGEG